MQSTAGPSKKRGHYATRACNGCRRRRCKCDGVHPTCGTCQFYGHDCSWKRDEDARRPATKQLVESLRMKIQVLEAEVARLQGRNLIQGEAGPGGPSNITISQVPDLDGLLQSSSTQVSGSTLPSSSPFITNEPTSASLIANIREDLPYVERLPLSTVIPPTTISYQYIFHINTSIPHEDLSQEAQLSLACDWSRNLPHLADFPLSRLEHDTVLYRSFKYGTSWLLALVPDLFLCDLLRFNNPEQSSALARPLTLHYSPLLHCCLLAFATAYSDNDEIKSLVVRDKFVAYAKQLLDEELGRLAPSLVQALGLLAEYHCGIGERDAGYMYMGMSLRAARALDLLSDSKPPANVTSTPSSESIINEWHFWSTFAQDKLMALEFARGYDIPLPPPGVNLPAISAELDVRPWPAGPDAATSNPDTQSNRMSQVLLESSKLMVITASITDTIYCLGPSETFVPADNAAINLHLQLDTWFNNLPSELLISVRANIVPQSHVILINICYWQVLLYLHQPFYQRTQPFDGPPNRDSRLFSDLSIKMCDRAAYKILQLMNIFDQSHGLRFFPRNMLQVIFACGSALLLQSATISETVVKKRLSARQGVATCVQALRTIAPTWPCAEKSADHLENLLQEHTRQAPIPLPMQSYPQDNTAEPELDDGDMSYIFYRFVHEWKQGARSESYSSGHHSLTPSPRSPLTQLGDVSGDIVGHISREHVRFSSSPLPHENKLDSQYPDGASHDTKEGDMSD